MNISCRFVSFGILSQNLANIIRPSLPFFRYEFTIVPIIENNPWEQTRGDWIFTTNNLKSIYVSDRRSMDNCYKKVLEGSGLASSIDDESPRLVEDYNHDRSIVSSRKKKKPSSDTRWLNFYETRTTLEKGMRRSEADFSSVERLERQSRASYLVNTSRKRSFREIRMAFRRDEYSTIKEGKKRSSGPTNSDTRCDRTRVCIII